MKGELKILEETLERCQELATTESGTGIALRHPNAQRYALVTDTTKRLSVYCYENARAIQPTLFCFTYEDVSEERAWTVVRGGPDSRETLKECAFWTFIVEWLQPVA